MDERRSTDEMKQFRLGFRLKIFQFFNHNFRYSKSNLMIQNDLERRLKGIQLLSFLLFLILSFDKLYSAINKLTNCRSELNIHIKSNLEIRREFKFRNRQLPLSFDIFPYPFLSINTPHIRVRGDDSNRFFCLGLTQVLLSILIYFLFLFM